MLCDGSELGLPRGGSEKQPDHSVDVVAIASDGAELVLEGSRWESIVVELFFQ